MPIELELPISLDENPALQLLGHFSDFQPLQRIMAEAARGRACDQ